MTSGPEQPPDGEETTVEDAELLTASTEAPDSPDARPSRMAAINRVAGRCLEEWRWILLAALVIVAMAVPISLYFLQYRPDRQIDDAAAQRAIRAASDGAVAVLSYSSDSLDRDFANAKSDLTGDFLIYYNKFSQEIVAPAVRGKQLTQTASVVREAMSELHPDSAVVLVFLTETTTEKGKPQPLTTPSSVRITLAKVNGSWLISKLDPYG
jgi:Mce-associated membrane protein